MTESLLTLVKCCKLKRKELFNFIDRGFHFLQQECNSRNTKLSNYLIGLFSVLIKLVFKHRNKFLFIKDFEWHSSAKVTVSLCVCHTFQYNLTNFESYDILSVSNTYTNGATKDILSPWWCCGNVEVLVLL